MKHKVTIHFSNIDESLYTNEKASVTMDVEVTDTRTLIILATHLMKTLAGDSYTTEQVKE
jgi:hypothetical protein